MPFSETGLSVLNSMKPLKSCPECGGELTTKISFKGRKWYTNRRKTQICDCGFSGIIPTQREAQIQLGLIE